MRLLGRLQSLITVPTLFGEQNVPLPTLCNVDRLYGRPAVSISEAKHIRDDSKRRLAP